MLAWFPEGTGPDKVKSDSKAEVWSKRADFEKAVTDYTAATEKLVEAARTGDLAQIQPAFGAVGKTCGGCHDGFRVPEE
jgi:cytochrome c556